MSYLRIQMHSLLFSCFTPGSAGYASAEMSNVANLISQVVGATQARGTKAREKRSLNYNELDCAEAIFLGQYDESGRLQFLH